MKHMILLFKEGYMLLIIILYNFGGIFDEKVEDLY